MGIIRVGIWSFDKLSHKSPREARQAIEAHYNPERDRFILVDLN
jgi:hypothetical protein